jgi:hypothetical protein
MTRYTTKQVADAVGVSYITLLRWLYAKQVPEPQRIRYGGQNLRLWSKKDIAAVRRFKAKNYSAARSRRRKVK